MSSDWGQFNLFPRGFPCPWLRIELNPYICTTVHSIIFKVALFPQSIKNTSSDIGIGPARISFLLIQLKHFEPLIYAVFWRYSSEKDKPGKCSANYKLGEEAGTKQVKVWYVHCRSRTEHQSSVCGELGGASLRRWCVGSGRWKAVH